MKNSVSLHFDLQASISDILPGRFKDNRLMGSTVLTASGDFGDIVIQSLNLESLQVYYLVTDISRELSIRINEDNPASRLSRCCQFLSCF